MRCPSCGTDIPAGFKFCGACGAKLDGVAEPKAETPATQRREVAVLFADVSGFTQMSERLDPEEVHALMNRCFAGLGEAIQNEGGYIDKYMGDNVMALFGAPIAHEDDPARACRAALAIQEFIAGFSQECERERGVKLRMRIGLNCGLVLAGGVGSDVRMDYTVMGDTVNLASRLESAAAPGTVLVSEHIHRDTRQAFEFGPPMELVVKGKELPVRAYQLLGEASASRVAEVAAAPLIGRERELALLRERIAAGRRWIEIRGEMGMGKTRLVCEAFASLPERQLVHILATPAICRRPFGLVRRVIHSAFDALLGQPISTAEAFEAALRGLHPRLETYWKALWYLVAPSRLSVAEPTDDPLALRRTIERGVFAFLEALAARFPHAVLFLDAYEHVDEASAALLQSPVAGAWPLPVLTATRAGAGPAPLDAAAVIALEPLGEEAAGALLAALMHGAQAPDAFRQKVLRRAAGVPLFLEEIVRALIEAGELASNRECAWAFTPSPEALKLPSSLRSAMVSRLDRLPQQERELLGHCAVQGVEFNVAAAQRLRQARGAAEAGAILQNLARNGVVRLVTSAAGLMGVFVQPLMQEACYETLLLRDRRELHQVTARALCELAGGAENVAPEALVFHYENSEQWENAAEANLRAANRAGELFLNDEALAGYGGVLADLERAVAVSENAARLRILAHRGAARVHIRTGAYPAGEACIHALIALAASESIRAEGWRLLAMLHMRTGHAQEAQQLLAKVVSVAATGGFPNPDLLSLAWLGLAELHHRAGQMDEAVYSLRCCRATAAAAQSRTTLRADLLEGLIAHTRGQFAEAAEHYRRAFDLAGTLGNPIERARATNNLGNVARDKGDYEAAQSHYQEALTLWRRTGETECIAGGHSNLGNLALSRGDFATARRHYEESLAACLKIGNVNGAALAHANVGILALEEEDGPGAIAPARAALDLLSGAANDILRGLVEAVLGDGHLLAGEIGEAEKWFGKVLAEFRDSTHPLAVATATRGLGRVAARRGESDIALRHFRQAIAGFERLKRSQEEARTVLEEARVLLSLGDAEGARSRACAALERFTAMRADRDAERARRCLREMEACADGAQPVE